MTTFEKIKNKIRQLNNKNIVYFICMGILVTIFIFVFLTTIIQTNWVGIDNYFCPILVWMISQPYVGIFFLPFLITIIYVCSFIVNVGKPVSIKKMKNDIRTLYENQQITKEEYEQIYQNLENANKRIEESNSQTQATLLKLIEDKSNGKESN